jgi:hypothetical protein
MFSHERRQGISKTEGRRTDWSDVSLSINFKNSLCPTRHYQSRDKCFFGMNHSNEIKSKSKTTFCYSFLLWKEKVNKGRVYFLSSDHDFAGLWCFYTCRTFIHKTHHKSAIDSSFVSIPGENQKTPLLPSPLFPPDIMRLPRIMFIGRRGVGGRGRGGRGVGGFGGGGVGVGLGGLGVGGLGLAVGSGSIPLSPGSMFTEIGVAVSLHVGPASAMATDRKVFILHRSN